MTSNQNGTQHWKLNADGTRSEIIEGASRLDAAGMATDAAGTGAELLEGAAKAAKGLLKGGFGAAENIDDAMRVVDATIGLNKAANVGKAGGRILGGASILISLLDATISPKAAEVKYGIDVVMGVASFAPIVGPFIGVGWFVGYLVSLGVNGKTLSENIQDAVK